MKKAIVIGATSGIGKELARLLVADNYTVGITGRRTELLTELKQESPSSYFIKTFDITDTGAIQNLLEELVKEIGGLDLVIINSGIGEINYHLDFTIEKRTIDTNVSGFTCVVDWAFTYFEKQKSGHLAAITSIAALRGNRLAPSYNASKAYQINYLEGLRQKTAKLKLPIIISDIRPGFVDTAMAKGHGLFWVAPVEKASQQIFNAIRKKKKIVYITKRWQLIAALLKIIPRQLYDRI